MVVITKTVLSNFASTHPNASGPLNNWYDTVRRCNWKNFSEIKETFGSVDAVGSDRFVFNIKGNSYRLIAMIHFNKRTLYIRFIGTHAEYNKINCSTI